MTDESVIHAVTYRVCMHICVRTDGPAMSGQPVDEIDACCVERMRCYSVVEASLSANSNSAMDYGTSYDGETGDVDMDAILGYKAGVDAHRTCEAIPYTMQCQSKSQDEPAWMHILDDGSNHVKCGGDTAESHEGSYGCCECDSMFAKCIARHQMVFSHQFVHYSTAGKDSSTCSVSSSYHQQQQTTGGVEEEDDETLLTIHAPIADEEDSSVVDLEISDIINEPDAPQWSASSSSSSSTSCPQHCLVSDECKACVFNFDVNICILLGTCADECGECKYTDVLNANNTIDVSDEDVADASDTTTTTDDEESVSVVVDDESYIGQMQYYKDYANEEDSGDNVNIAVNDDVVYVYDADTNTWIEMSEQMSDPSPESSISRMAMTKTNESDVDAVRVPSATQAAESSSRIDVPQSSGEREDVDGIEEEDIVVTTMKASPSVDVDTDAANEIIVKDNNQEDDEEEETVLDVFVDRDEDEDVNIERSAVEDEPAAAVSTTSSGVDHEEEEEQEEEEEEEDVTTASIESTMASPMENQEDKEEEEEDVSVNDDDEKNEENDEALDEVHLSPSRRRDQHTGNNHIQVQEEKEQVVKEEEVDDAQASVTADTTMESTDIDEIETLPAASTTIDEDTLRIVESPDATSAVDPSSSSSSSSAALMLVAAFVVVMLAVALVIAISAIVARRGRSRRRSSLVFAADE